MRTKITINGQFTDKKLKDISSVMKALDFSIEAITFPLTISYEIDREEGREYVQKLREYLTKNAGWSDELSLASITSIDISYIE